VIHAALRGAPGVEKAPGFLGRHYWACLIALWLACSGVAIVLGWSTISAFRFHDPDDVMRLMEVRDWQAGQSWFDVTQYRLNPPTGFSMHWSRLLDLPLAAVIALLKPWFGQRIAETAAAVIVPMITFGAVMALVAELTRRRVGPGPALLAAAFCLISVGYLYALPPMRIDHHGWAAAAGLGLVLALTSQRNARGAAVAGLCAALWNHISLEGIAFTAGAAAWLGLRWIATPKQEGLRLPAFLGTLTAASLVLYFLVHGTALISRTFCDAVSPVHLVLFGSATILTAAAHRLSSGSALSRTAGLAAAAFLTAAIYRSWAPQCLGGPFNALDPLTRRLWYMQVHEGRPLWELDVTNAILWIAFPLIGLLGSLIAWRATEPQFRASLLDYAALLAIATAIGVLVLRAGAFANLLAIPGNVMLIAFTFDRTKKLRLVPRAGVRAAATLLLCPVGNMCVVAAFYKPPANDARLDQASKCLSVDNLARLNKLPSATFMTPLDLAPALVAGTHHRAVAAGYHRNAQAMREALIFFTAGDDEARALARRHETSYLALCKGEPDVAMMARLYPKGLAARLSNGRPPAWLRPIPSEGVGVRLYSIQ